MTVCECLLHPELDITKQLPKTAHRRVGTQAPRQDDGSEDHGAASGIIAWTWKASGQGDMSAWKRPTEGCHTSSQRFHITSSRLTDIQLR
jgi:hypothetical protein